MIKPANNQKGYVISMVTFFVLVIMTSMAISMSFLATSAQKNITDAVKSTQSYYAAEAGIEDVLLRLKKSPQISSLSYSLSVNNATVDINIPNTIGGSKAITSEADNGGISRNIQAVATIANVDNVSFYYGVEVGAGGLFMGSGSEVIGNVFSSGNISGSGTIDNDAVVSGNGHSIQGVTVKGSALAYSCLSPANVMGNLTYVTGGSHTCTVGGATSAQAEEISQQPLPIPQSQIDEWKADTANGTPKSAYTINSNAIVTENSSVVITGNMSIGSNATWNLMGTTKIIGNLTIGSNAHINMSDTLYVTGIIGFGNNSIIALNSSYGSQGGVILSDGIVTVNSNVVFNGSGQAGSYILVLSTSASNSAIGIGNNANNAFFYTSEGTIQVNANASVKEVAGYKVSMGNNSTIQYSTGVVNIYFSSGPGGGWKVTSWQEQ